MQLDRIVAFHKTIGDKTRLQIIALLKQGPLHGQALASKLGVTPPTISYHLTKLREIDIVYQRRDKNTIYFYLHEKKLQHLAQSILELGNEKNDTSANINEEEKTFILKQFFNQEGKLTNIPALQQKKRVVLAHLIKGFEMGRTYDEQEVNEYIGQFHEDFATIRREFIMGGFMYREKGKYTLNPPELWKN